MGRRTASEARLPRAIARAVALRPVARLGGGLAPDAVAIEEPLEIRVDGEPLATTMRTPGADEDLALGFLLAEGIIGGARDVSAVVRCGRPDEPGFANVLDVRSGAGVRLDPDRLLEGTRRSPTTSACGVCGRASIDGLVARLRPVDPGVRLDPALLGAAMDALARHQPVFAATGGVHGAVLLGPGGELLAAAEDVGRHNAVDKAVGALVRQGRVGAGASPGGPALLAVSGRAGFEIVQKAAAAGVPAVASVSAPTTLAIALADRLGMALAGFVRGDRYNVYAHAWRLGLAARGGPEGDAARCRSAALPPA